MKYEANKLRVILCVVCSFSMQNKIDSYELALAKKCYVQQQRQCYVQSKQYETKQVMYKNVFYNLVASSFVVVIEGFHHPQRSKFN